MDEAAEAVVLGNPLPFIVGRDQDHGYIRESGMGTEIAQHITAGFGMDMEIRENQGRFESLVHGTIKTFEIQDTQTFESMGLQRFTQDAAQEGIIVDEQDARGAGTLKHVTVLPDRRAIRLRSRAGSLWVFLLPSPWKRLFVEKPADFYGKKLLMNLRTLERGEKSALSLHGWKVSTARSESRHRNASGNGWVRICFEQSPKMPRDKGYPAPPNDPRQDAHA